MSQVIASSVNLSDASGQAFQQHLCWCEWTNQWLLCYVKSGTMNTFHVLLNPAASPTNGTWTEASGSPITLSQSISGGGANFAIGYLKEFIANKDVVHVCYGANPGTPQI